MGDFNSSQFLPKETEEIINKPDPNATKATEHGAEKDSSTGSTESAASTETNPKTISPPSAPKFSKPTLQTNKTPEVQTSKSAPAKTSVTNPATLSGGKIGVVEMKTETDNMSGVNVELKRNDGITLQFNLTFNDKTDLYSTKNMFDLMGKCINASEKQLQEEFPAFIKG